MIKSKRVGKLEGELLEADHGLRVVTPLAAHYDDSIKPYWTNAPVEGLEAFYRDEDYPEVKHPEGKEATHVKA